jgi:hypothetical protein
MRCEMFHRMGFDISCLTKRLLPGLCLISHPAEFPSDNHFLYLISTFKNLGQLGVPEHAFDRKISEI